MLIDFLQFKMAPLLMLHHLVCLVCHSYAITNAVTAFPSYFVGVVVLEAGSGLYSTHVLWPRRFTRRALLIGMSASNLGALGATVVWHRACLKPQVVGRWLGSG